MAQINARCICGAPKYRGKLRTRLLARLKELRFERQEMVNQVAELTVKMDHIRDLLSGEKLEDEETTSSDSESSGP
jgi:regulator of replication initiation timing